MNTKRTYDREGQSARFALSEALLQEAGGKRVNIRLQPPAAEALEALQKKWGANQTEAINRVLIEAV